MADKVLVKVLKQGTDVWNWRRPRHGADLSMADLRQADLGGADLSRMNLEGANLSRANLREASLWRARLRSATLGGADLSQADLSLADLSDTDLSDTNLYQTNLWAADLTGADITGCTMNGTIFGAVDLSTVKGLAGVRRHSGPSIIDIRTIYLSKGNIPEIFLRGAGVPDSFIVEMRSLAGAGIEFASCFISYSTKDQDFADRLYADLQAKGVRCWFAPHDVKGGKKLYEQIDEAIHVHDRVLLILSIESMNSEWVETEIATARERELAEKRQVLFPVRLVSFDAVRKWKSFDADARKDSAREIREYFIPDFSNWKDHDSYREAFGQLLKGLKGEKMSGRATH